jgi:hypothetical protein
MKTSELQGAALDWAVAKAADYLSRQGDHWMVKLPYVSARMNFVPGPRCVFTPSTRWAQGGPIIESEGITTAPRKEHGKRVAWVATLIEPPAVCECEGKTQLIAAMRCFVASKLGDTVNIPEELRGE